MIEAGYGRDSLLGASCYNPPIHALAALSLASIRRQGVGGAKKFHVTLHDLGPELNPKIYPHL